MNDIIRFRTIPNVRHSLKDILLCNQGNSSIAIGINTWQTNQLANSIVLNASGLALNAAAAGLYVANIRNITAGSNAMLAYNTTLKEITYWGAAKTFVIQHPIYENKYLVHGCVEGPSTELIYRGKDQIIKNDIITISLPQYATKIGFNWTINVTPIGVPSNNFISCSEINVETGTFDVYGNNSTRFFWTVYGQRTMFDAEPYKNNVEINGEGPYKWFNKKN